MPVANRDPVAARGAAQIQQMRQIAPEAIRHIEQAVKQFDYFLDSMVYILDPQKMAKIKWSSWPCHRRLSQALHNDKLVIVLKARQLGITWEVAAYALWLALLHYGARVAIFSRREKEAAAVLERCRFILRNLPPFFQQAVIKEDNDTALTFGGLDSGIFAYPATEDSGRSESATLVIADEWAFHPDPEQMYAAVKPIIDAGSARFVGISTGNGAGTFFHSIWQGAVEGTNNFRPLFFPWRERPGRDDAWYEKQKREYSPSKLKQEYPDKPEDAFQQTGNPYFDDQYLVLRAFRADPDGRIAWGLLPDELKVDPDVRVYQLPRPGRKYVLGVDVAEGEGTDGDASEVCATLLDAEANEEVLFLCGRWNTHRFAAMIDPIARYYSPCLVGVERNGLGIAVIKKLEELGTPGLFRESPMLTRPGQVAQLGKHGWATTGSSKPIILERLEEHLRYGYHRVASQKFLDQARVFQDLGYGKFAAPRGFHDDAVMSRAIAIEMRNHLKQLPTEGPRVIKRGPALTMMRGA